MRRASSSKLPHFVFQIVPDAQVDLAKFRRDGKLRRRHARARQLDRHHGLYPPRSVGEHDDDVGKILKAIDLRAG